MQTGKTDSAFADLDEVTTINPESRRVIENDWQQGDISSYVDRFALQNEEPHGRMKLQEVLIGRSLGAKLKDYNVMDLYSGETYQFVEGSRLQNVEVFAGKGTRTEFRNAWKYAERYGGNVEDWQHVKGFGVLETDDGQMMAEIHWVQCNGVGMRELFIKRWLE